MSQPRKGMDFIVQNDQLCLRCRRCRKVKPVNDFPNAEKLVCRQCGNEARSARHNANYQHKRGQNHRRKDDPKFSEEASRELSGILGYPQKPVKTPK